ncbi:cytosolic carboxypeptidase 2 [Aythya fuligula]|uniref:Cytosolic carboxypeptidase 2 n=1 Tax=Aythya fuligula TaxID=219594 RepID=A0A6J3D022_AYTFU|nr:cytosolic carboxypeptidase 2 [Aythya fuligula]
MDPSGYPTVQVVPEPYDSFMRCHLRYYGYFRGEPGAVPPPPLSPGVQNSPAGAPARLFPQARRRVGSRAPCPHEDTPSATTPRALERGRSGGWGFPGEPRALFALPSARGPLPTPRWPIECEVIKEAIEHIEWVPPEPEPFCQPSSHEQALAGSSEEQGTVVYHLSPVPPGSCFTRARAGGAPGPLSSPAVALEGPQDTTLLFESRFESGNLQKAVKVGPYEYVLTLRPDLYTAKHTQWFYFRVQNTRRDAVYRFTIANLAKPKSLYGEGMQPLLYSQRDARSRAVGWRRVGDKVRYYRRGGGEEPATFCLSWSMRFPHDADTCYLAHSYPYTYSDLQRYLRAVVGDPVRSRYCAVRALCRSLAGNTVYLLTITGPAGGAGKRAVVLSARAHPGESGGSWAMRGFLDFVLSAAPDARLLRRLFVFKVVPMLNPDGVVVGNSRCSLAGRDPNRAYRTGCRGSFPAVWHLRAMVERLLVEREVVLYCDFHGHSRKNNVFMYGCDGGRAGAAPRFLERVFPLMLSKNAPDKFSFPSCKFKVQKSKEGTGRVVMWRLGITNSYTMEAAFGGSTLGGRNSHFTVEDLKSLGYHLCDTLLDFCDPDSAKFQQCLAEVHTLLRRRLGSGGSWSDVPTSDLESSTSGSDSSVSEGPPAQPGSSREREGRGAREEVLVPVRHPGRLEPRRRKRLRSRRARNALHRPNPIRQSPAGVPVSTVHPSPAPWLRPHTAPSSGGTAGAAPSPSFALPQVPPWSLRPRGQPRVPNTAGGGRGVPEEPEQPRGAVPRPPVPAAAGRGSRGRGATAGDARLRGDTKAVGPARATTAIITTAAATTSSSQGAAVVLPTPGAATAGGRGGRLGPASPRCYACARR